MSNSGTKSAAAATVATNGRNAVLAVAAAAAAANSANNSKSINQYNKNESRALHGAAKNTTTTTVSSATTVTAAKMALKAHNNEAAHMAACATAAAAVAAHRRDNSICAGQQQAQTHKYKQHSNTQTQLVGTAAAAGTANTRQYRYAKPQIHLQPEQTQLQQQQQPAQRPQHGGDADSESLTSADEQLLLVYSADALISGSLEALITHMVPTAIYYPDRHYIFAFLLSSRLFIRPHELLAQISHTWERQQQEQHQQQASSIDVVDDATAAVASHNHHLPLAVIASASPLTQRKHGGSVVGAGGGGAMVVVAQELPLDVTGAPRQQRTATQKSAQHCIRLLSEWIETFPYDFRDERLMQQVRILARKCVYIDNSLGKQVSRILQLLVQRLTALEQYEEFLQSLHTAADLSAPAQPYYCTSATAASASYAHGEHNAHSQQQQPPTLHHHQHHPQQQQHHHHHYLNLHNSLGKSVVAALNHGDSYKAAPTVMANHSKSSSESTAAAEAAAAHSPDVPLDIIDMCPSCAQLAHQLTAIELERLSHIGPEEFVQAFAKEYQHSVAGSSVGKAVAATAASGGVNVSSSLNDLKKTRNLESYVEWFNRLSYFTASEIVKYGKKKQRVRVIEYFIETARECFNIGNFNSLMAIIAGLNLAPISRLKKTWSKVQSAKFSVLEHQMDPTSNFNSYRSTLKAAMWRSEGATDERERIIIPFFSLFVKDLYFLNEGCSNRLPNNHINFEKCSQLAKQIMEFNEWKKVCCPYEKLPNIIAFLQTSPVLNENTLSMASFECEPPENTEEKGRYKTVKAETKQQLLQQLQEQQQQQHHQHTQ